MRHGILRSLAALLGGIAFAVAVAGPAQWCACPTHGADVHAMDMHHAHHGSSPHETGHQCSCPGGCTSTAPVALHTAGTRLTVVSSTVSRAVARWPAGATERASSPQLVLPFANAPPRFDAAPYDAAQLTT